MCVEANKERRRRTSFLPAVLSVLLAFAVGLSYQQQAEEEAHGGGGGGDDVDAWLSWRLVTNDTALCNDFTRAGFFHRPPTPDGAGKWIIFLESGGVCYSNETCNRRFFNSAIRQSESLDRYANSAYGDFDTNDAFRKYDGDDGTQFVNPLMSSMQCFLNDTRYFPDGPMIRGTDLFDRESSNHSLSGHGQVVIPYCSSDVWLGAEDGTRHDMDAAKNCDCMKHNCFGYKPDSSNLQFTFRGKTIFQSVLRDLDAIYNLSRTGEELILIGSSAGGIGALNLAKWVREEYPGMALKVITDSAWFVNFRDGINQQFSNLNPVSEQLPTTTSSSYNPIGSSSHVTTTQSHMTSISPTSTPSPSYPSSDIPTPSSDVPPAPSPLDPSVSISTPSQTDSPAPSSDSPTPSPLDPSVRISMNPPTDSPAPSSNNNPPTPSASIMTLSINSPTSTPIGSGSESGSGSGNEDDYTFNEEEEEDIIMKRYAPLEYEANKFAENFEKNRKRKRRDVTTDEGLDLLKLLKTHDSCSDTHLGYPCCLSAQCVLSSRHPTTDEPYFPSDVSLFVITSLYDAFILGRSINEQNIYSKSQGDDSSSISLSIDYLTLVGEYGGVMDSSLVQTEALSHVNLTFYASQCFQHIYFTTSSLWGKDNLLGTDPVQISKKIGTFSHSIQSGIWNKSTLAYSGDKQYTIMSAIDVWYQNGSTGMNFRDKCRTPHCNPQCPEQFAFDSLKPKEWPVMIRFALGAVVVAIALLCIFLKTCFYLWLKWLEHKQTVYLNSITPVSDEDEEEISIGVLEEGLKREFPICTASQAISVACLDLHYSVTTRVGKQLKDEKKENFAPIVLSDLSPEEELNGSETDNQEEPSECDDLVIEGGRRRTMSISSAGRRRTMSISSAGRRRTLSTSSGAFQKIKNAFTPNTGMYHVPTFRPENENIEESIHRIRNGSVRKNQSSFRGRHDNAFRGRASQNSNNSHDTFEDEVPLKKSRTADMCNSVMKKVFRSKRKKILKGLSVYFNPGEMVGIMGPSGCGKTTFLDILTGRRKSGTFSGQIFINGVPLEENREWYTSNTGYVIQLARPYYEELTVRENLTLAAWIRLKNTAREKFQRVEQVMDVTGLLQLADTVVGGATGPGLSGGQKRRLAIALQLLKLPSVIFLDEPTSGLDAASSRELLAHLNALAASNRTVVLTIHQPRLEIFHMFDRLVLLSDGKVAYHGVPDKAYEVFVNALRSRYLQQRLIIPDLEDRNPADVIMDMLGNQKMRQLITDYYQSSGEPNLVNLAVKQAWSRERKYSLDLMDGNDGDGGATSFFSQIKFVLKGTRMAENTQNHLFARLAALEARATKRATPFVMAYLPIIFFIYGLLLGTVYFQQDTPFLIVSGFCVYSVASALFMFPALYSYYNKALEIYSFEHADGAGRAYDLVIQPFLRFITMAIIPVITCALVLYMLLVDIERWSWLVFGQLVVVNIALNQAWVALLIWLILTFPKIAIRLSPPLASVMGFTSGFFIPIGDIPPWYVWLSYINPNYYGFSASAFLLLNDLETDCERDKTVLTAECILQSGENILREFDFADVNPYYNITILLGMTVFLLLLSIFSNFWNHVTLSRGMKKVRIMARRLKRAASIDTASVFSAFESDDDVISYAGQLDERGDFLTTNNPVEYEEEEEEDEEEEEEEEEQAETIVVPNGLLSPIAENHDEREMSPPEETTVVTIEDEKPRENARNNTKWDDRSGIFFPNGDVPLPTSLPEIPSAVSPRDKTKHNWTAIEMTEKRRSNSIERDTFTVAQSEPPTPEKNVAAFQEGFPRRRASRMNSLGEEIHRPSRRRKKSVKSVYLRDGEAHAVWKPSALSPTTPTPPPHFIDVVQEVMRKMTLRERQKQLQSRVTATQQVLKEQNEELATVAELTEDDETETEKEGGGPRSMSAPGQRDTPGRKMWQHLIKSVIDEKKESDKSRKRNRKRSTVHFHEVVTNKLASMDPAAPRGLPSISEQEGSATLPNNTPQSPKKPVRRPSTSWRRQDAVTPHGAIPFTEWKSQFNERQRGGGSLRPNSAIKQVKSDYNLKARATKPYGAGIQRINSENHLTFPVHRRVSVDSGEELEPRSKSVSQYRHAHAKLRRSSSPELLDYSDYDDHGGMSDTSVALDDMFSPLSSRSVSPLVFSDEEEQQRRSKMRSRTPNVTRTHQPLMKLDSEEIRILENPSNMQKRARHRQQHQDTSRSGDDIIEIDPRIIQSEYGNHMTPVHGKKKRPKRVSISLPTSPRGTPSPRPTSPLTNVITASPAHRPILRDATSPSPSLLNDRISRQQQRRESLPHLPLLPEESEELEVMPQPRRAVTPDVHSYSVPHQNIRRSSTPTALFVQRSNTSSKNEGRKLSNASPVPLVNNRPPRGRRIGQHVHLYSPTGTNPNFSQTTV